MLGDQECRVIVAEGNACSNRHECNPKSQRLIASSPSQSSGSSAPARHPPKKHDDGALLGMGLLSAFVSLVILPEIFGSMAIILGAYAWRMERDHSRSFGLVVLVLGIAFMIAGIYFTAYFVLGDFLY
jgi:hypothetical protein